MSKRISVGIVAPSSVLPKVELRIGLERLQSSGFTLKVHPQCRRRHRFFAGSDSERAQAFYGYAVDSSLDVIWCARGGYGAARLLPLLERMTAERGIPERKLLIGCSDATALMEFVRSRWSWSTLHAAMPAVRHFSLLKGAEWKNTLRWIQGKSVVSPWEKGRPLRFFGAAPSRSVNGELVGGNLSVWVSLVGTPHAPRARRKILLFEDVGEKLYRIDRMVRQLEFSGGFDEVKAIVLGTFQDCDDGVLKVLREEPRGRDRLRVLRAPAPRDLALLRPEMGRQNALREIFGEVGERFSIPVAYGLPVGHGPYHPMPLGAEYRLRPDGRLQLLSWDWGGSGQSGE